MKRLLPGLTACAAAAMIAVPAASSARTYDSGGFRYEYEVEYDDYGEPEEVTIDDVWRIDAEGKRVDWDAKSFAFPDSLPATITNGSDYATYSKVYDDNGNFLSNVWTQVSSTKEVKEFVLPVVGIYARFYDDAAVLESVTFPDTVEWIDGYYGECTNLATVVMGDEVEFNRSVFDGTPWRKAQGEMFIRNGTLVAYDGTATDVVVPEGVEKIGDWAFEDCTNLVSVTLPSTLESIGYEAFYRTALASVVIPEGVEYIGVEAFANCTNLVSVTLPSTLEEIDDEAFRGCGKLSAIAIPEGVEYISDEAFENCTNLVSVTLPSTLEEIGSEAFYRTALASVAIPEGVEYISDEAFAYCANLVSVTLPSTLEHIGDNAFYRTALASVVIPEGVEYISDEAFADCTNLVTVTGTCPELRYVGSNPFYGTPVYENIEEGLVRVGPIVFGWRGEATEALTIPEGVSYICSDAFYGYGDNGSTCSYDEKTDEYVCTENKLAVALSLPSTLKHIGGWAFESSGVTTVTGGENVESVGYATFWGTPYWNAIQEKCGDAAVAFDYVRLGKTILGFVGVAPAEVAIPDDVVAISSYLFDAEDNPTAISNITSVVIGSGLESLPDRAFYSLPNLVSVTGGAALEELNDDAFGRCEKLATVELSGPLDYIDDAFEYCGSLTDVTLGARFLDLDDEEDVFYGCTNLVNVTFNIVEPDPDDYELDDDDTLPEPYVRVSSLTFFPNGTDRDCAKLQSVKVLRKGWKMLGWEAGDDEFPADVSTLKLYRSYTQIDSYCNTGAWDSETGSYIYYDEPVCVTNTYNDYSAVAFRPQWRKVLRTAEDDGAFALDAKASYIGWLTDADGKLAGFVTVKTAKGRNGVSKTTATVTLLGQRKISIKDTVDANGVGQGALAGLTVGANGLYGTLAVNGVAYDVDGARDVSKTRLDPAQNTLAALKGKVWTLALEPDGEDLHAFANGCIGLSVTMGAKGKAKVSGVLPDGGRVNASAQTIVGDVACCIPVVYSKPKDSLAFLLWIDSAGKPLDITEISDWKGTGANRDTFAAELRAVGFEELEALQGTTYAQLDDEEIPEIDGLLAQFLPYGEPVFTGAKWTANKAAVIRYKAGAFDQAAYDLGVSKGKTNDSGLKLTYTPKTGLFKGSFKVYTLLPSGKIKKYTAKVNGVVLDGYGYGSALVPKVGAMPFFLGDDFDDIVETLP